MSKIDTRTMECSLIEGEVIRLILRPKLPFYPDQAVLRRQGDAVEIELREGRSKIVFKITEDDLDAPLRLLSATVVNILEFTAQGSAPDRDSLIELSGLGIR